MKARNSLRPWRLAALATAAGLASCAAPTLPPGATEADAVRVFAPLTGRYAMPGGGTRLEFARGPYGRETWMVDLDAQGRTQRFWQALAEPRLHEFQLSGPGMSRDELLRTLGRPAERRHGGLAGGEVWSWRYVTNECMWYQVSIDDAGKVTGAGFGIDPRCDANDRAARP